ncbi:MAG: hypothetical protein EBU96_07300 [Actinobacteria bacterium]|nr:hypothetical protein [Actinomycetota bacterium]
MSADRKSSPEQIVKAVYDPESKAITVHDATNLVPSSYDEMITAYVGTLADPDTVTYKKNGTVVAVVKFEYDTRGRLIRVSRQV